MTFKAIRQGRDFLKAHFAETPVTDQMRGLSPPLAQKPCPEGARLIDLVPPSAMSVGGAPLRQVMEQRRSWREFGPAALTHEQLSFLLWATQGVRRVTGKGATTFRTVPSAGSRHAFETYLSIRRVEGVKEGLYRYLGLEHKLCFLKHEEGLPKALAQACYGQHFVAEAAVVFAWTAVPYRMEWRYATVSHKVIAIDAGHVSENLYLAAESVEAGACAIAAYDQEAVDRLIDVDGEDEFTVLLSVVGRVGKL